MNRIKFKNLLALIESTAFEQATAKVQDWKQYEVIIDAAMDELVAWYDETTEEADGGFIFIDSDFPMQMAHKVSQLPTEAQDSLDKALKHRIDELNARWIELETKRIMQEAEDDDINIVFEADDDPIGEMMRAESMIEGARLGRDLDEEIMNQLCAACGKPMQLVRPGKYQCVNPDCEYRR